MPDAVSGLSETTPEVQALTATRQEDGKVTVEEFHQKTAITPVLLGTERDHIRCTVSFHFDNGEAYYAVTGWADGALVLERIS